MTNTLSEGTIRESQALYTEKAQRLRLQEEEIARNVDSQVEGETQNILRLMPNSTPEFMHIPLDFLGFCLVNIVENGLLMPGKPNLGVFKFNEKYCVFADLESIDKFIANPNMYLE